MSLLTRKSSKPGAKKTSATTAWAKGTSGNPAGRPVGSRNKLTLLLEALLEDQAEKLTRKLIQSALKGDPTALRFCGDRILPRRKGRTIQLPLQDLTPTAALKAILTAIGEGEITPEEGETVSNIVAKQAPLEFENLERRISELELTAAQSAAKSNRVTQPKAETATDPFATSPIRQSLNDLVTETALKKDPMLEMLIDPSAQREAATPPDATTKTKPEATTPPGATTETRKPYSWME
jgi:hypothetical protein